MTMIDLYSALPTTSRIAVTAYSITSAQVVKGHCMTTSGSPVVLPTPFTFVKTSPVAAVDYQSSALEAFSEWLGFTSCSGAAAMQVISSLPLVITLNRHRPTPTANGLTFGPKSLATPKFSPANGRTSNLTSFPVTSSSGLTSSSSTLLSQFHAPKGSLTP